MSSDMPREFTTSPLHKSAHMKVANYNVIQQPKWGNSLGIVHNPTCPKTLAPFFWGRCFTEWGMTP